MACDKRERTGSCGHFQCPFPDETPDGYNCVDIYSPPEGGPCFCEIGDGCLDKCEYSWQPGDNSEVEQSAEAWNKAMDEELRRYNREALEERLNQEQ